MKNSSYLKKTPNRDNNSLFEKKECAHSAFFLNSLLKKCYDTIKNKHKKI
jgi:hypothetical protein